MEEKIIVIKAIRAPPLFSVIYFPYFVPLFLIK